MLVICKDCKSSYTISISEINQGRYSFYCKKCPAKLFFYVKENLSIEQKIEQDLEYPKTVLDIPKDFYSKEEHKEKQKESYKEDFTTKSITSKHDENIIKEKQTGFESRKSPVANLSYLSTGIIFSLGIFILQIIFKKFGAYFFDMANLDIGLVVLLFPVLVMIQLCIYISSCGYFKSTESNSNHIVHRVNSIRIPPVLKIILCSLLISLLALIAAKSIEFFPISDSTLFPVFLTIAYVVFLILSIIANGTLWFYPCKLALKDRKRIEDFSIFFDWCAFGFFLSIIMLFVFAVISFPAALLEYKFVVFKYSIEILKYILIALGFGLLFKLTGVFYIKINNKL